MAELLPGAPLLSVPYGDSGARIAKEEEEAVDEELFSTAVEKDLERNDLDAVGVILRTGVVITLCKIQKFPLKNCRQQYFPARLASTNCAKLELPNLLTATERRACCRAGAATSRR